MKHYLTKQQSYLNTTLQLLLVAFLCVSFVSQTVHAQGVTPTQIAQMKSVTGTELSADGQYAAYTVSVPADPTEENKRNSTHLYVLNTQTGESTPYVTDMSVKQVQFRPTKGTFTFLAKMENDEHTSLYELRLPSGDIAKIYSYSSNLLTYDWQAEGNRLAFVISEKEDDPKTSLPYTPDFYEETFSQRKAFVVDVTAENPTPRLLQVQGSVYMVKWSPNGQKIAVSAAPTSSVDDFYMKQQVLVVNSTNGTVSATIDNKGKLGQIVWSPDSNWLALKAAKDLHDPTDGRILIVSVEGGEPQIIDAAFKGKYEAIEWPEANAIYFHASKGTGSVLGSIRPNGKGKKTIFESGSHNITSFSRSNNGAIAFTASSPQHPTELFTLSNDKNGVAKRRTEHNKWLNDVTLGQQKVISYTARDGAYDIEGILIYPINYQEGNTYPLITVVHGGPEAHYTNGWLTGYSVPGQMAAAKGYAVFYPNYRGSTGRGHVFTYSSQGDLAGKEFDDIVDGVDYLIAQGIADKDRIGVTGGSYGGYASAWMSTYYSDRFAAAVMFVGISNNISKWGTSDIPEELFLVHSRKRIWNDWDGYLKRSPVYYVDRAQTPILIMHGANDPRVHPAQSMELYRHLKVRKPQLPVRLIYYPGEGHGNAHSASKYDYNLRMLQWFDTYLKTGNANAPKPSLDLPNQN